jgi:hypothetical protein
VSVDLRPVQAWTAALVASCPVVKYVRLVGSRAVDYWRPDSDWDLLIILDPDLYAEASPGPPPVSRLRPESWTDFELWITLGGLGTLPDVPGCRSSIESAGEPAHLEYWFLRPAGDDFVLGAGDYPAWLAEYYYSEKPDPGRELTQLYLRPFYADWLRRNSPGIELYAAPGFLAPFAPRSFEWPCETCGVGPVG